MASPISIFFILHDVHKDKMQINTIIILPSYICSFILETLYVLNEIVYSETCFVGESCPVYYFVYCGVLV